MDKKITKNVEKIIEKNGWTIYDFNDGYKELSQFSPAGEDFSFSVMTTHIIEDVKDYAENFDPEEHALMWYGRGLGEPTSLRALLEDTDAIKEMLENLAKDLEGVR